MKKFAYAPVRSGDKVGYAEYLCGDDVIAEIGIVAEQDCGYAASEVKTSLYDRLIDRLKELFKNKEL